MKPQLLVMAAGLGSRFGGLKQLAAVDGDGCALLDYSLFDARRAGFEDVVFVIKRDTQQLFQHTLCARLSPYFNIRTVCQDLDDLPQGFALPAGRVKPWGTGHAVAAARCALTGAFAVLNADDYYGPEAFRVLYAFLASDHPDNEYAMVAYRLSNTLSDNGSVSRGVCSVSGGYLTGVTERRRIESRDGGVSCTEDGQLFLPLDPDGPVSMNLWGFSPDVPSLLWERFPRFLTQTPAEALSAAEYPLPGVVNDLLTEGRCRVRVLDCAERWHGVTYSQDLAGVRQAIAKKKDLGLYPLHLYPRP